jgi:hypothetical protein
MTINIVKLSVGTDSVEDLARWQEGRRELMQRTTGRDEVFHTTRMVPKRQDELLDGGSLYWVIKGVIQVRQRILDFRDGAKDDGTPCCFIMLDPEHKLVRPTPRRAFQGWRYLEPADAPEDLGSSDTSAFKGMPAEMRRELAELCLI